MRRRIILSLFFFSLLQKANLLLGQTAKMIIDVHVTSLPQDLLLRVGINTEIRFDSSLLDLKTYKTVEGGSVNEDSLRIFGKKIVQLKSIDIRSKLVVYYKNGRSKTILISGNGLLLINNEVYYGTNYLMNLIGYKAR